MASSKLFVITELHCISQFLELLKIFSFKVSKNQLEKLTINTRYHPPTPVSNNNNGGNSNYNSNSNYNINGSNCQIGSNTNAVTVVKVK